MAKIPNLQIFGGSFEDLEGSLINKGYLLFELSHDAEYATGPNQVVGGIRRRVNLDASGNVPTNPAVMVYSNDVLLPSGTFYIVRCFKADGTEAWASPQNWIFAASPNPLDLGTVVPTNPPGSGTTGGLTLLLETNGTANGSQSLLNLKQGTNVTLVDNGSGQVTINSSGNFIVAPSGPLPTQYLFWTGSAWTPVYGRQSVTQDWIQIAVSGNGTNNISQKSAFGGNAGYRIWINDTNQTTSFVIIPATATESMLAKISAGPTATKFSGITGSWSQANAWKHTLGTIKWFRARLGLEQTTNTRMWIGISDVDGTSGVNVAAVESNTPALNLVGFRFVAGVDTHWQMVAQTDASHQTVSPTTVVPNTSVHVFEFYYDGAAVQFFIDGVNVGNIPSSGNPVPATTVLMDMTVTIDNIGTANTVLYDLDHVIITTGGAI